MISERYYSHFLDIYKEQESKKIIKQNYCTFLDAFTVLSIYYTLEN